MSTETHSPSQEPPQAATPNLSSDLRRFIRLTDRQLHAQEQATLQPQLDEAQSALDSSLQQFEEARTTATFDNMEGLLAASASAREAQERVNLLIELQGANHSRYFDEVFQPIMHILEAHPNIPYPDGASEIIRAAFNGVIAEPTREPLKKRERKQPPEDLSSLTGDQFMDLIMGDVDDPKVEADLAITAREYIKRMHTRAPKSAPGRALLQSGKGKVSYDYRQMALIFPKLTAEEIGKAFDLEDGRNRQPTYRIASLVANAHLAREQEESPKNHPFISPANPRLQMVVDAVKDDTTAHTHRPTYDNSAPLAPIILAAVAQVTLGESDSVVTTETTSPISLPMEEVGGEKKNYMSQ